MWITRFQTKNYASLSDSGPIELDQSFNIFVGSNNSGKSALLRSLNFPLTDNPHKNPTLFRGISLPKPIVEIDLRVTSQELEDKFSLLGERPHFPIGNGQGQNITFLSRKMSDRSSHIDLEFTRHPGQNTIPRSGASIAQFRDANQVVFSFRFEKGGLVQEGRTSNPDTLWKVFNGEDSESYFFFRRSKIERWNQRLRESAKIAK